MAECVLRQCGGESPIVYEGPGLITQEADRSIRLRVFAAPVEYLEAFKREFERDLNPGQLAPDSEYYDFEGKDSYGTIWKASRISVGTDFGSGTYVRARPRTLEKMEERSKPAEPPVMVAFLPGEIELPWHTFTENEGKVRPLNTFEKKTGGFYWRVVKTDDGAWLTFKCDNSPVEPIFDAFLRGLSILTGTLLRPVCRAVYEGNHMATRILNRLHEPGTEKLPNPIKAEREFAEDSHLFLERFLAKSLDEKERAEAPCVLAHRYWHRILRARENDIENSSLVLSVAVEGLIKKTLLSKTDADPEFVKQLVEARPILKKAGLGARALECVLSSVGNAKHPRVQDTLRRLVADGVASEAHLEAWKGLRHAAAHGGILEDDDRALQEYLDRFHVCLDLYYRLVFLLIEYEGKHIDYGKKGWPTSAMRAGTAVTPSAVNEPISPLDSQPGDGEPAAA